MQQFIPFEDDWDALEQLRPEALIPYRVGLVPVHEPLTALAASAAAPEAHWPACAITVAGGFPEKSA
jgi:hypothetical protein